MAFERAEVEIDHRPDEDVVVASRDDEPGPVGNLGRQLPIAPSGVTSEDADPGEGRGGDRGFAVEVDQHDPAGHPNEAGTITRVKTAPADTEAHRTGRLYRAAGVHRLRPGDVRRPTGEHGVDGSLGTTIEDEPGRTLCPVGDDVDDGPAEVGIVQFRRCDQQHAGGRSVFSRAVSTRPAWGPVAGPRLVRSFRVAHQSPSFSVHLAVTKGTRETVAKRVPASSSETADSAPGWTTPTPIRPSSPVLRTVRGVTRSSHPAAGAASAGAAIGAPPKAAGVAGRPSVRGLLPLLKVPGLRRLMSVRVLTAFGDGAFQGALASLVLFDPSSKSTPAEIATAFTVLLLPYSIIGPFAGALLDRWSRRQVIFWANLFRALVIGILAMLLAIGIPTAVLFAMALLVTGAGRFVGSGLSASLPHVIASDSLVGANSLTTTVGAVAGVVGGGYAIALKGLLGSSNGAAAGVTATVILFYLGAAFFARGFAVDALGPDETDEPPQPLFAVLQGLAAGFRHIVQRPTVGINIAMVTLVRFCFGIATLVVLLLFRHYFTEPHGLLKAGAAGIGEVLGTAGLGLFLGAVLTAPAVAWLGRTRYVACLLSVTAVIVVSAGLQFTQLCTLIATLMIAFAYQSSKICADTVVQSDADDAHIGRVFALYDTANNILYVAGFVLGVALVPVDGLSRTAVILVGVVFVATAAVYGWSMPKGRRRLDAVRASAGLATAPR